MRVWLLLPVNVLPAILLLFVYMMLVQLRLLAMFSLR